MDNSDQPGSVPDHPVLVPDHHGLVPDHPSFEGVQVPDHPSFEGVRFLTTLDRFLAPPNFRGGQEPVHPGQVPDTPEKLNFTKTLKT